MDKYSADIPNLTDYIVDTRNHAYNQINLVLQSEGKSLEPRDSENFYITEHTHPNGFTFKRLNLDR